jgi:UDP-glucose:(heptosyl)LPS alpha-1,3-glucosyltransferase
LKIGLAIYNFNPQKGGAERYAYDLSINLLKKGHEVVVFCSRGVVLPGVTLVRLNTVPFPRWLRTLSFALNHKKYVNAFSLDVMLGFGNILEPDVYQSHGGVQRIWMEREIASYDNPKERKLKAFLLKHSINQKIQEMIAKYPFRTGKYRRIVAISDMVKEHMTHHYNLKEDSIDTVYNGVDIERFRPAEVKPPGNLRILFSAGNFRLKGLFPLLLAAGELSKETKNFHLFIMGRGRRKRYSSLIEALNLKDYVTFLGEKASPETVYRDSHILVHPTFYDACSLTTMEAMASALPVITTRWNGASALISPDEGYVLEDPYDVSGLSSAIKALFDEERRDYMGKNARLKLKTYTIERNADEMEKIFFEVCNGR